MLNTELSDVMKSLQDMLEWIRQTEEKLSSQQPLSENSNEIDTQGVVQKVRILSICGICAV